MTVQRKGGGSSGCSSSCVTLVPARCSSVYGSSCFPALPSFCFSKNSLHLSHVILSFLLSYLAPLPPSLVSFLYSFLFYCLTLPLLYPSLLFALLSAWLTACLSTFCLTLHPLGCPTFHFRALSHCHFPWLHLFEDSPQRKTRVHAT